MAPMRRLMSSVARAVSWARSLTSLATTAKPLPASPARAASMAALRASRLVCSAIEVMALRTSPISALEVPSLPMVFGGGGDPAGVGGGPVGGVGELAGDLGDLLAGAAQGVGGGGDAAGGLGQSGPAAARSAARRFGPGAGPPGPPASSATSVVRLPPRPDAQEVRVGREQLRLGEVCRDLGPHLLRRHLAELLRVLEGGVLLAAGAIDTASRARALTMRRTLIVKRDTGFSRRQDAASPEGDRAADR
jgi:hypothetical protein